MDEQEKIFKQLYSLPMDVAFNILISFVIVNSLTGKFAEFYKNHKVSRGMRGKES